jgi:hypothetical protein
MFPEPDNPAQCRTGGWAAECRVAFVSHKEACMARPGRWVPAAAVFVLVAGAALAQPRTIASRPTVTVYKTPT